MVNPPPLSEDNQISNQLIPKYLEIDSNTCTEIEKVSSYVMEDDGLGSEL